VRGANDGPCAELEEDEEEEVEEAELHCRFVWLMTTEGESWHVLVHTIAVPSAEAESSIFLSWEKHTSVTRPLCARKHEPNTVQDMTR
jgi:hypothetical protein